MIGCPARKRVKTIKFLWWTWKRKVEDPHNYKINYIKKIITIYQIIRTCSFCGCSETEHFVDDERLYRLGIDRNKIRDYGFSNIEDCQLIIKNNNG